MSYSPPPALPPESAASIQRSMDILDAIESYKYVAAVYHQGDDGVTWFLHAFPADGRDPVTVRLTTEASAHLIKHAAVTNIGRTPDWKDDRVRPPGAGPVIEAFPVVPADVAHCVDITWIENMLLVAAREPDSFTRQWNR